MGGCCCASNDRDRKPDWDSPQSSPRRQRHRSASPVDRGRYDGRRLPPASHPPPRPPPQWRGQSPRPNYSNGRARSPPPGPILRQQPPPVQHRNPENSVFTPPPPPATPRAQVVQSPLRTEFGEVHRDHQTAAPPMTHLQQYGPIPVRVINPPPHPRHDYGPTSTATAPETLDTPRTNGEGPVLASSAQVFNIPDLRPYNLPLMEEQRACLSNPPTPPRHRSPRGRGQSPARIEQYPMRAKSPYGLRELLPQQSGGYNGFTPRDMDSISFSHQSSGQYYPSLPARAAPPRMISAPIPRSAHLSSAGSQPESSITYQQTFHHWKAGGSSSRQGTPRRYPSAVRSKSELQNGHPPPPPPTNPNNSMNSVAEPNDQIHIELRFSDFDGEPTVSTIPHFNESEVFPNPYPIRINNSQAGSQGHPYLNSSITPMRERITSDATSDTGSLVNSPL